MVRVSKWRLTISEEFFRQASTICGGNNLFIAPHIGRRMAKKEPRRHQLINYAFKAGGRAFDTRAIYIYPLKFELFSRRGGLLSPGPYTCSRLNGANCGKLNT